MVTGVGYPSVNSMLLGSTGSASRGLSTPASDLLAVQATSETDARIGITTDDGDTVTIALHSDVSAGYAYYRPGTADGSDLEARALVASVSRELDITVQGSLDEQEMADVSALVKRLAHAIRSFLKGHVGAAFHQALQGPSLDSLAGFSLEVQHTESLTAIAAGSGPLKGSAGLGTEPVLAPLTPALPGGDPGTGVPVTVTRPRLESPLGAPRPDVTDLLDMMQKTVKDSGIDLGKLGKLLEKTLQRMLHRVAREPGMWPARPALEEIATRLPARFGNED